MTHIGFHEYSVAIVFFMVDSMADSIVGSMVDAVVGVMFEELDQ